METQCPALFIAAPTSGTGKTSLTAGLARYHRHQGRDVRIFKIGPDYLDPKILEHASGHPVYQLDLWMVGEVECRRLLFEAATQADLILIEGAMGLFDGKPSGADLAELFAIPVVAVINARSMAQTFAAIAHGLASFRPALDFAGVVATQTRSDYHREVIQAQLSATIPMLAVLPFNEKFQLPVRHLGLVQPEEQASLDAILDNIADELAESELIKIPPPCTFSKPESSEPEPLLAGIRIGIANDAAFNFIYPANLDVLTKLGAQLIYFSPLCDTKIPSVNSLWFPGGYPELYARELANNRSMSISIQQHFKAGKKIYAECGGLLYVVDKLFDLQGRSHHMLGLLPGIARMTERSGCQGMQATPLPEGELTGHAHHRSTLSTELLPIAYGNRTRSDAPGEAVYQIDGLTASYLHSYFASSVTATCRLLGAS